MYLDKDRISTSKLFYIGCMVIASLISLVCFIFMLGVITSDGDTGLVVTLLFILGISSMFIAIPAVCMKIFGFLNRVQNLFSTDADGIITVEDASKSLGMSTEKFTKKFNSAIKHGYLINCSLGQQGGDDVIILVNGSDNATEKFEVVKCKNCGAFSEIKLGFVQACPYCGGPLLNPNRNFDIFLKDAGREKILTLKVLVDASGLRLKHAFDLVLAAPTVVMRNVPYEKAVELEKLFREAGATVELQDV